jgi:uncharacterized protein YjbJ (UPF0337 family)
VSRVQLCASEPTGDWALVNAGEVAALLWLENGSWFPDTACSAIIRADVGSHLGNVGLNQFDTNQCGLGKFPQGCIIVYVSRDHTMDKDRVKGSAKIVKGRIKEAVGKAVGDAKLESEGKADKIEGKVQNAVGGLKDAIRGE